MAVMKPLVIATNGKLQVIQAGDTFDFSWLSGLPTSLAGHGILAATARSELAYTAAQIPIVDAADYYAATNVEAAFAEGAVTIASISSTLSSHTHTFASLTSKPTTLTGYGITDAIFNTNGTNSLAATTDWRIAAATGVGFDTLAMRFQSGGAFNTARGAILELNGVNAASYAGAFRLLGGVGGNNVINVDAGGSLSIGPGLTTFSGDLVVSKSSAIIGIGASGSYNGGLANYAAAGTGDIGIFSEHAAGTIRVRPNGRLSSTGQTLFTTTDTTFTTAIGGMSLSMSSTITAGGTIQANNGIMRAQGFGGNADSGVYYFGNVALDNWIYKPSGLTQFLFRFGAVGVHQTATLDSGGTIYTTGNFNPASYVAKTGDTMTGQLQVNAQIRMRGPTTTNPSTFMDMGQNPTGAAGDNDAYYYNRVGGIWFGTANVERGRMLSTGELRWTGGEIQSTNSNPFRMVQGNYGAILRQDGANFYFLMTASGDQYGSWNSLRPLTINMVTGAITFGHGVTVNQTIDSAGANLILGAQGGNVYFRPNGSGSSTGEARLDATGNFIARDFYAIRPAGPTTGVIYLGDQSGGARYLFYDGSAYFLPGAGLAVGTNIAAGTTIADALGNVRSTGSNVQNASYTLQASDFGKTVEKTGTGAINYTLGTGGTAGDMITILNSGSSGNITIVRSGSTLYSGGVNADIVVAPGTMRTVLRSSVAGRWQA